MRLPMDSLLESLLITWTDPAALGAAALAVALVVFVAWRVRGAPAPKVDPNPPERNEAAGEDEPAARKPSPGKARSVAELVADEEVSTTSLLSRFVLNNKGETVGETLGLDGDDIVLKHEGSFLVVAQEAILEKDGMLLADANIDWDEARERGNEWQKASRDEIEYDGEGMPIVKKE